MGVVETDLRGGVFTITLADEANRNALGSQLVTELIDALNNDPAIDGILVQLPLPRQIDSSVSSTGSTKQAASGILQATPSASYSQPWYWQRKRRSLPCASCVRSACRCAHTFRNPRSSLSGVRWTITGASIVVASGLYLLHRERVRGPA